MTSSYWLLGIGLVVAGAELAPISYFVAGSVPLTAIGLSAIILGLTSIFLANARPHFSAEAYQLVLKTGEENTALLEEGKIKNKAIYLPNNTQDRHPQALIPLTPENDIKKIKENILRTYNKLIVSLAVSFGVIDVALALSGQSDIANYFMCNALAYFIITFLFVNLSPRVKASLNTMSAIVFTGFLVIVAFRVIEILK